MMKSNIIKYGILLLLIILYDVFYELTGIGLQCPFKLLTGLYCPGCGVTRMLFSIIHLNFYQAFRYNPLVFIILVIYLIYRVYLLINKKESREIPDYIYYIFIVMLIIYGILRNIDCFNYLIPTDL